MVAMTVPTAAGRRWLCRCAVDFQVLNAFSAAAESGAVVAVEASGRREARGSKVPW